MLLKVIPVLFLSFLFANVFGQSRYNVKDFGASGDGQTLNTRSIQQAIDQCHADSGGVVFFPPGVFVSGTLQLRSTVTLEIGQGATLQGSRNLSDYQTEPDTSYVLSTASRLVFLRCADMHDVSISGEGVIDGLRLKDPGMGDPNGRGPLAVFFENSRNVKVSDVTILNSAGWALTFFGCNGVTARNVTVLDGRFDGINPVSSSDVLLDACTIDGTGDDPITIKNEGNPRRGHRVENVIIRNCIVRNTTHPAVKIGTGTAGIFRNIHITGCIFENTGEVFSIQLMRPSLSKNPERVIENILFTNNIARNVLRFLDITTLGVDQPVIQNLHFSNIIIDEAKTASRILGNPEAPIHDISIEEIFFKSQTGEMDTWLKTDYLNNLRLRELNLQLNQKIKSILDFSNGDRLNVSEIEYSGLPDLPRFRLHQAKNVRIKTNNPQPPFPEISIQGNQTETISVRSDFPFTTQPALVSEEVKAGSLLPAVPEVEVFELKTTAALIAGDPGNLKIRLQNKGPAGMFKLAASANQSDLGSRWLWLNANEKREVSLDLKPVYQPGKYEINVAGKSERIQVQTSPARIIIGDTMQIASAANDRLTFTLTLQNTGGQNGQRTVELKQNGQAADRQTVHLSPGEIQKLELTSQEPGNQPFSLTVEEFPEWRYQTTFVVPSEFYFTKNGEIFIDAGGRSDYRDDYGAVYLNDVVGDFDATVKFGTQQPTGMYAAIGLVVRNDLTDFASNGFSLFTKVLKYGGMNVWMKDLDGDGKIDHYSSEGGEKWYRLSKRGKTFSLYIKKPENFWKKIGSDYLIESANETQDVGIFGNAFNNNKKNRVTFEFFEVTPVKK